MTEHVFSVLSRLTANARKCALVILGKSCVKDFRDATTTTSRSYVRSCGSEPYCPTKSFRPSTGSRDTSPTLRSWNSQTKLGMTSQASSSTVRNAFRNIVRRRFMSIARDRTSTPIRTLLADPDNGDRAHGREVSCRLHEHQRCITRKPRPTAWGNGSIKVPQPQRGVTRIQDSEFRPVGASNRLGSKTQAVGLGYRVTHLRC